MINCRTKHLLCAAVSAIAASFFAPHAAQAQFRLVPAATGETMRGPDAAKGVVIWSHGRSVDSEDSLSPTPEYMAILRRAGWDTLRFNRMRATDTLTDSSRELVRRVEELKRRGYRQIVLTGQSYGAFLSLMAADATNDVSAVVATAPAAYGSFSDFYKSWEYNATALYPILAKIRNARVMLFYFHGDDFDPGGRGVRSREIFAAHNIDGLVIDQPPDLTTHWAASTGLFVRRFGDCIRDFIDDKSTATSCNSSWGDSPSKQIAFPGDFRTASDVEHDAKARQFAGKWYGYYENGREVMFAIERAEGNKVTAIYSVGPGLVPGEKAEWSRRTGHIVGHEIVFDEKGLNELRYRLRPDGRLEASWLARDGKATLQTTLHRTDEPTQTAAATTASAGAE